MDDIDKRIAWHYAQIALLKAKRNTLAPIWSLPIELLSRIITIYAVESDNLFRLHWTKIMYVCRHWRELVLAAHKLWSFLDLGWSGGSRIIGQLSRAGRAQLSLRVMFRDSLPFIPLIMVLSDRIWALEIMDDSG
ncbi:hypothetical protein FB451DRAFT_448182 [Mycena latifolia]|nr:hypothetical protein FB451DRAFT_448182 [Mycena latifolia]